MAMPAFRSATPVVGERGELMALPPSGRQRLAIVSTSSKLCGIAAYTAALRRQLQDAFDITVFDLNQYLLRNAHRRVRRLADQHVKEICRALRTYDAVNLQLEHGTLGRRGSDIYRRFCWLTEAAPRLSVTFHSLHMPPRPNPGAYLRAVARLDIPAAARMRAEARRAGLLSVGIARQLRRMQRQKPVSAIVHNRRDFNDVHYVYGVKHVFDHPLSYLDSDEVAAVHAAASRRNFPMLDGLPADGVLIGVFGFLSEYKGIATAIQALRHLPDNHHLLIFGGVHPHEIAARQPRHPYISSLFSEAYIDRVLFDQFGMAGGATPPQLVIGAEQTLEQLVDAHPRDLSGRIHFMGALAEEDFLRGMAVCDAVVFPYLEVGQSSSGPMSQALELGCRIVASRTHAFLEFAEYHKNAVEFFDIGNHLELAERLSARRQFGPRPELPEFNVASNKATYLLAHGNLPAQPDRNRAQTVAAAPARS